MKLRTNAFRRWLIVAVFAVAMAWVESAVVYYLRTMVDRIVPYQTNPLPLAGGFGMAEMIREAATLVMLLMVGILAGRTWRARLGYTAVAFGIWDIFYYVFLKAMCGWPDSLWDWDVLFLLPLPWWGPVLAPIMISVLLIIWGTVASQFHRQGTGWKLWLLNFAGMLLALYIFMADTLRVSHRGIDAVRKVLPDRFEWFFFCCACALMATPAIENLWWLSRNRLFQSANPRKDRNEKLAQVL